jgi:hypothetical protein
MKKNTCEKNKHHKFLWLKWDSVNYNHKWMYISKEKRVCEKCKRAELFFGLKYYPNGDTYEDWRLKY